MANNTLIAKNAIFLYFRMAFVMIVSIYVSRVVLAQLGETDFGIYNVIGGVVAMILSVNSALSFGTQRFISFYLGKGNTDDLRKTFSSSFIIHLLLGLIIVLLLETIGVWFVNNVLVIPHDRMYAANVVLHVSVVSTFLVIIQVPFTALIIAHERMNLYAYVALVDCALKLWIAFQLSSASSDKLIYYSILMAIVQLIQILIYVSYCFFKFEESKLFVCKDKSLYKEITRYSGWNLLGTVGFMLSDQGVNMLLNIFYGPVINAARAVAMQINNAVRQFIMNLQTAFNPQLVKMYAQDDRQGMLHLLNNNVKYSLTLLWVLFLPIFFEMDYLLSIWLVKVPDYSSVFARIIILRLFLVCFEQPFITVNGATGNNKTFVVVSACFLLSVLPLSYISLLVTDLPQVVFVIDLIVYIALVLWKVFYLKRQVGLSPYELFFQVIKPVAAVAVISIIPLLLINSLMQPSLFRFCMSVILSLLVNIALVWNIILGSNAKSICFSKVRQLFT